MEKGQLGLGARGSLDVTGPSGLAQSFLKLSVVRAPCVGFPRLVMH